VTVSVNGINLLGAIAETQCVSCEVRTEFSYIIQKKIVGEMVKEQLVITCIIYLVNLLTIPCETFVLLCSI
jgi:hypothetical protein